jgi:hypothetical protein
MSTVIAIVIVGFLFWCSYGRAARVLARKQYATRKDEAPDLSRFAERSPGSDARTDDRSGPGE